MEHIAPMLVLLVLILASWILGSLVGFLIYKVQCWRWTHRR